MQAVRFDRYGGVEVLDVRDVAAPEAAPGGVVVRVKAAAINPGEMAIREGVFHERWPATFPSGEGSDLAGVVEAVGEGVDEWQVGDEVFGWSDERSSHAELVAVPAGQLVAKPAAVAWEVAGSLYVAGVTAHAAVASVAPAPGETVVVTGAAGGVGGIATQLAVLAGARVIGLAGEHNHDWLRGVGAIPVGYGDGQAERVRAAAGEGGVDAFIDTFGPPGDGGYLRLALGLGIPPQRVDTIIDFPSAAALGTKADALLSARDPRAALAELADLAAKGELEVPIARAYPLAQVRDAYAELARRHTRGKIVLVP